MNHSPKAGKRTPRAHRHGFTVTEILVSALLLTTVMSVVGPLAVRGDRLWQDARHGRLALEELTSQLDRLTCLTGDPRKAALAELTPSKHASEALPNPKLSAKTVRDQDGQRLVLQLTWDRPAAPGRITLVGWIDSRPQPNEQEISP